MKDVAYGTGCQPTASTAFSQSGIPNADTLEDRLQRLFVEKGIRQITLLEPDEVADARFSVVRVGYNTRGFGATLSEAYANCKGPLQ